MNKKIELNTVKQFHDETVDVLKRRLREYHNFNLK